MEPTVEDGVRRSERLKELIIGVIVIVAGISSIVWFLRASNKDAESPPLVMGHREGCLMCHMPMEGLTKAHDPAAIGCFSCHLGNPFTLEKDQAHATIVLVPGNLETVSITCGTADCHPLLSKNIRDSLMATGRGIVSVNRYVFGEVNHPDGGGHLSKLGESPAQDHLRKLCASCHLARKKSRPGPGGERLRGGGCTACHLNYSKEAMAALERYRNTGQPPNIHPALTLKVDQRRCFGCHSRSGRISTNYEGWHETMLKPHEIKGQPNYRILEDGRVFEHVSADIHFERGMDCVDCHTWRELMGDGKKYFHQEDQVEISCEDCHPLTPPQTISQSALTEIDSKILDLRQSLQGLKRFVLTRKNSRPLINVSLDEKGGIVVIGKSSGKVFQPKKPRPVCSTAIYGHERLTCQSCHTPWAPSCIHCHTYWDATAKAKDHITGKVLKGRWIEQRALLLSRQPALGVRLAQGKEVVDTFIPGMILTIDTGRGNRKIFRRLYAPTAAHTTSPNGLDCQACHLNGVALGLGEGLFSVKGNRAKAPTISFQPIFPPRPEDGLALDAWIGFLAQPQGMVSTRKGARPLTASEQRKVLRVGICLMCHPVADSIEKIYKDFPRSLKHLTPQCLLPSQLDY